MSAVKTTKWQRILGIDAGTFWFCMFWSSFAARLVCDAIQPATYTTTMVTTAAIAALIASSVAISKVIRSGASSDLDVTVESGKEGAND